MSGNQDETPRWLTALAIVRDEAAEALLEAKPTTTAETTARLRAASALATLARGIERARQAAEDGETRRDKARRADQDTEDEGMDDDATEAKGFDTLGVGASLEAKQAELHRRLDAILAQRARARGDHGPSVRPDSPDAEPLEQPGAGRMIGRR